MKTVKIEVSETLAYMLQRMIVDEINNQEKWFNEDSKSGNPHAKVRIKLIADLEEDRENLSKQGYEIFDYYY